MKHHPRYILMLGVAASAITASAAAAQAPAAAPGDGVVGEVVVTASRVSRGGFTSPTPTTVLGQQQLEARGFTNVGDAINETPAFRATSGPAAGQRGGGNSGGTSLDLRGLNNPNGATGRTVARTLVLVDGRRFVPSTVAGLVDLNMIPSGLVERTEVVTGGASAAWGSDAIAGVVNIILKNKLQGVEGNLAYGQSDKDDYKEYTVNLAAGTAFAGGKGHIIAGFDYVNNKGVPDPLQSRDWGKRAYSFLTGATFPAGTPRPAGVPSRLILPDFRQSSAAPGGLIVGGPLNGIEFLGGQNTRTFTPGYLVVGTSMFGGGANDSNANLRVIDGSNLVNPIERNSAMVRVNYDLTEKLNAFVEVSRAVSEFNGFSASRRDVANITVRRDNAFLPESVRAQMTALGLQTITVGRIAADSNYNFYTTHTDQQTERFVGGFKGEVGSNWKWDAYYEYGRNHFKQQNQASLNSNYAAAVDSIVGANGQIVCRTTALGPPLGNADPGCVPFNIFGQNSPSQAAVNYVRGVGINNVTYKQQVAAANVNGDLFALPAGPVGVAAGVEYRKEEVVSIVDANSQAARFDLNNFQPIAGKFDTKEVYGEVAVPLVKDAPFFKSLEANGAIRYTDYSTSGGVTTWKVGGSWKPVESVRFRATESRDIRAPNLGELYAGATQGRDFVNGAQQNTIVLANPNLLPERAKTFTAGVVYQPGWAPRLNLSADYHNIRINGAITSLTAQQVFDRCNAGVTSLCSEIARTPAGAISSVTLRLLNFNAFQTSGWDFEASYSLPRNYMVPGQIQLRLLASFVDKLATTDAVSTIDRVKQIVPGWISTLDVNYNVARFTGNAQFRYVGPAVRDVTLIGPDDLLYSPSLPNSVNDNTVPAVWYLNLSASYDIIRDGDRRLQIYGVVNNVLDRDPPGGAGGFASGFVNYDLIGRAFRGGVRFKY